MKTMATKRRFSATSQTTVRDLQRVMMTIGATSLKINQDVMSGGGEVIFDRNGKRYKMTADTWIDSLDNLRAIGLTITYLYRALESYGVKIEESKFNSIFESLFGGFIATPEDTVLMLGDGSEDWWKVLGVEQTADKRALQNAFRALAKIHHPDAGGDAQTFAKLRAAYDKGMARFK